VKDAEANAEEDRKFTELVTVRNQGETMLHATKKTLAEAGDKATAEEKATIEAACAELEEALKGKDKELIETKTTAVTDASAKLAQKLYAEQAAASSAGPDVETAQSGNSKNDKADDAVDAEFEEIKDK